MAHLHLNVLCSAGDLSLACDSNAILWTYYPCSFILSPTVFDCHYGAINLSIDECRDQEIIVFWHFPLGNITLTLNSNVNRPFLLHLSAEILSKNQLVKNIYHVIQNKTLEERIIYDNKDDLITFYSDKYNECSIKFETSNVNLFHYGTFIQMAVLTDDNRKY